MIPQDMEGQYKKLIDMLNTLQKGLGNEWTGEVQSAWINCYAILSGTMITVTSRSV